MQCTFGSFSDCFDTDNNATDKYGTGCDFYEENPARCGQDDDEDFSARTMCCSCKGIFCSNQSQRDNHEEKMMNIYSL